ncbi:hypothetical protein POF50_020445 [Streptomyces sp. SL13]|uniref:Cobyrinic acid a,c-diamide synthase n=1 Tax=Streptantibioticus silvisoli TaxID=2705255 RepID=A0AA90H0D5_9ACTN|nr:hypothetical protein [Streptantibioticus silvisoli]MDI5966331.1 hypothetical protein [Streptantibioticus silvisoli]MDI5971673.1 hypothetical protein [Streptantibioticus silvisoli]
MSLPGADELFRTTGGMALQSSTPRQHSGADPAADRTRQVPGPATEAARSGQEPLPGAPAPAGADRPAPRADHEPPPPGAPAPDDTAAEHTRAAGDDGQSAVPPAPRRGQEHTAQQRRRERRAPNRRPSGRERHDEKITVYVSAEELMDLEHARLVLRGEHGLAVDRGRIVREAVAVVLADLESRGDASILVRRLRGR